MSAQPKWAAIPHPDCEVIGRVIKVDRGVSENPMTPDEDLILAQYERIKELEGFVRRCVRILRPSNPKFCREMIDSFKGRFDE